jgi:PASTA domain containing protein
MNKRQKYIIYVISFLIIITLGRSTFISHFYNKKETVVPNLLFMNEKEAIALIKKSRLKYHIIYSKSGDVNENYTFLQDPKENSIVKVNREVRLWVNKSDSQEIPELAGKTLIEARRYLDELNIDIQRIDYMPTDNIEEDTVLAVYPKAGKKVGITTKISLLVSSKSLIDNATMPNLIGLDKNEASKILAQIGLKINLISDAKDPSFPQNAIIATNPLPGSSINKNTRISIVLNTGIEVNKSIDDIIQEEKANEKPKENEENKNIESILNETLKDLDKKNGGN